MNALLPLFTAAGDVADQKAANLLAAARALTPHLNRSRALDRKLVSGVMTTTFGASDAEGAWLWRDAYDAIEAALVLQLRRLSPQIGRLEDAPADIAALLANLSALSLTHTRRSEEQVALDQFSTPPELGALAVGAASQRSAFTALGCFTEIIAHTPRVFVPIDKLDVLAAVLAKWPPQSVLQKAD